VDISEAIAEAVDAALPVPAEEVTEEAEAKKEPVAKSEEGEAPVAEAELEVEAEPEKEAEPAPDLPEGFVAVPTVSDKLATDFTIYDEEGELEIPALIVEYKANGKVRKDRLDQVVKLAQWGVYNEDRAKYTQAVEQKIVATEQELSSYASLLEEREKQIERLLNDDDFFYNVKEAYENESSPARRAERAEQELQSIKIETAVAQIADSGERFYQAEVGPAIGMIVNAFPTVTESEVSAQLARSISPYLVTAPNGEPYIPESRYQAVRDVIVKQLAVWANMVHVSRNAPVTAREKQAQAQVDRARVEAQKAKRSVGRATQPVGRVAKDTSAPKQSKPSTIDEALDSAINSVLSSIR
jgi:hypothetical protein